MAQVGESSLCTETVRKTRVKGIPRMEYTIVKSFPELVRGVTWP